MTRRATLPDHLGAAFTIQEAASAGFSRRRLGRPDLDRRFRGIRMRPLETLPLEHPVEERRRELLRLAGGYRLHMAEEEFFSHTIAAVIWGLPVSVPRTLDLDVSVLTPGRAPRSAAIRGHQVRPFLTTVVRHAEFRLTSPVSTWAMLGGTSTIDELVAIGDTIARVPRRPGGFGPPARPPVGTVDQLHATIEAGRREGIDRLRTALPLIRTGSSSRRETELRLLLVRSGLPEPDLDVDVLDELGTFLGCSELAYPRYRVALEYEGDHHRTSRRQWDRDVDKQQLYAEAGWSMIRVTARLLDDRPRELLRRVEETMRSRGWRRS